MNRVQIICFVVVLLCAACGGATYFGYSHMAELKSSLESLTYEYNGLNQETTTMVQRRVVFQRAFDELARLRVGVGENVDFYSETQQAIHRGGARVLANAPNPPRDGRISMRMTFIGDYYAIMRALAELRELPNVVRVISLNLASTNPDDIFTNSDIRADIMLEALSYR